MAFTAFNCETLTASVSALPANTLLITLFPALTPEVVMLGPLVILTPDAFNVVVLVPSVTVVPVADVVSVLLPCFSTLVVDVDVFVLPVVSVIFVPVAFTTVLLPAPSVVVTLVKLMLGLSLIWAWLAVTAVVILVSPTIAKVEPNLLLDVPEAASLKYNGVVTAVFKLFNAAATPVTLLATPFGLLTTLYVGAVSAPVAEL
ncbi:hypothetical protein L289_0454 [Acinetobacter gerneri DSM 14967 = CIP 107464 = MTCC 9824]|nr:hypothetical protein L289_0454 [Acinetobacter gerneri DSM 14967 = CIP 107464 = MTCC 9824]